MASRKYSIQSVYPELDGGRYRVKTEKDCIFTVIACAVLPEKAEIYLMHRKKGKKDWKKETMLFCGSNRFASSIKFKNPGFYEYTVKAEIPKAKKAVEYGKVLEVEVNAVRARFSAWYEMFHRSQGKVPGQSATFDDMIERLEDIEWMGFDTIYLPPIHPIGITKRKGRNNSLQAGPNDPGSPWAIGNHYGGHKAVNPELGTMKDFKRFIKACSKKKIDIAIDLAFNCSPDHPYLKEHPEWFFKRADGSIAYAENPPKKYEDIYPLNFLPENKDAMWEEMLSIFTFWCKNGITTFRVDNPHTKPTEFWEWLIREIKNDYPEAIFLAEAFTNFDKLEYLARVGFTQSYTYFTWRNEKNELMEYLGKLTGSYLSDFLYGNLFVNTPDICPPIIQKGGRPAFKMRIALAATLSSLYGMYNGFELCEGRAYEGTENYVDSEKYEYKVWDWNRSGNIKEYIATINRLRREHKALQQYDNLTFHSSTNEHVIFYSKTCPETGDMLFIAVNCDPYSVQDSRLTLPVEMLGLPSGASYTVDELITGKSYKWMGRENNVRLDPQVEPAYIFRVR